MEEIARAGSQWESDDEGDRLDNIKNKIEMSVRVQTHVEDFEKQKENSKSGDINSKKCGFKHFVEESTLKNVDLDELEELSDAGCTGGADGDVRRTSSSGSSFEAAVKYAVVLRCDKTYVNSSQGLLRFALMVCSTFSLGCIVSAGTINVDVLELPLSCFIRIHIFICVFSVLVTSAIFFIEFTVLVESFPPPWIQIDACICGFLGVLFILSSSFLLHAENVYQRLEPPIADWTRVQTSLAAVFGFLSMLVSVYLSVARWCASAPSQAPEDIMLSSIRTR